MAAAKNSSLLRQVRPYWPHVAGIVLLSSQPSPAFLGVLMPAGAPQSASAVLAVAVGHGGDCLTRLERWPGEH